MKLLTSPVWQNPNVFMPKNDFKMTLMSSKICAPVLLNLLNLLQKRDKMLGKPHILSLFLNSFNKFNKT